MCIWCVSPDPTVITFPSTDFIFGVLVSPSIIQDPFQQTSCSLFQTLVYEAVDDEVNRIFW